jgi:hypothetical protein
LTTYTSGYYEKSLNPSFTILYQYISFVFSSLLSASGQTDLSFAELQIFGKEIISNSITSQIYTTSNIVKGLAKKECPFLCKHYSFNCYISTPIVIGSTTYYKYDIDVSKYTAKGTIQSGPQSGDVYRIFKFRSFYSTMYFNTIVNELPNVLYYDIFMSYKAVGTPLLGSAGLNITAIGFPVNLTLTNDPKISYFC